MLLSELFADSKFNGDISKWNVSNVTTMDFMFHNSKFNGDLSNWNVKNARSRYYTFDGAPIEKNLPKWDPGSKYQYKNKWYIEILRVLLVWYSKKGKNKWSIHLQIK